MRSAYNAIHAIAASQIHAFSGTINYFVERIMSGKKLWLKLTKFAFTRKGFALSLSLEIVFVLSTFSPSSLQSHQ
jgi:hypothetical protein